MSKQVLVVGLGQFGMALARALTSEGVEVIAVDRSQQLVQEASGFAAQTLAFDATDEEALAALAPERRDACVCGIGNEAREAAILVTALLRQLGAPRVVARSSDALMARILRLVGAHEVINPEHEFGVRFARRLAVSGLREEFPLGSNLVFSEIEVKPAIAGRSLRELELPRRFGITVLGVQGEAEDSGALVGPDPDHALTEGERLLVVGRPGAAQRLLEEW